MEFPLEATSRQFEERGLESESLCSKCGHSIIYRRKSKLEITVFCDRFARIVPSDIVVCNRFQHYKAMDLWEMKEIAVDVDKRVAVKDGSYR